MDSMHSQKTPPVKVVHIIHYSIPDFPSVLSLVSHSLVYWGWAICLYTDYPMEWKSFIYDMNLDNVTIFRATKFESPYAKQIEIPKNMSARSDILRVYLLLKYGGLYADSDMVANRPIDDNIIQRVAERNQVVIGREDYAPDEGDNTFESLGSAFLYAPYPKTTWMRYWFEGFIPSLSFLAGMRVESGENKLGDVVFDNNSRIFECALMYPNLLSVLIPNRAHYIDASLWAVPKDVHVYISDADQKRIPFAFGFHLWRSAWKPMGIEDKLTYAWVKNNPQSILGVISSPYIERISRAFPTTN